MAVPMRMATCNWVLCADFTPVSLISIYLQLHTAHLPDDCIVSFARSECSSAFASNPYIKHKLMISCAIAWK